MTSEQKEELKERVDALDYLVNDLDELIHTEMVKGKVSDLATARNGVALQSFLLKNLYVDITGENPWK